MKEIFIEVGIPLLMVAGVALGVFLVFFLSGIRHEMTKKHRKHWYWYRDRS
jgi:hypothetical protein